MKNYEVIRGRTPYRERTGMRLDKGEGGGGGGTFF